MIPKALDDVLTTFAPRIVPEVGEIFACAKTLPGVKGSWDRAAFAALAANRSLTRPLGRSAAWGPAVNHDPKLTDLDAMHARAATALRAHEKDTSPLGETNVRAVVRLLLHALSQDGYDAIALLRRAFRLESIPLSTDAYREVLGPAVTSTATFASYLVGLFDKSAFDGAELAEALYDPAKRARVLLKASESEIADRLDRWLMKSAPSAHAHRAAARMLVVVGVDAKRAKAIVALAGKRPAPKLVRPKKPLPDVVERPPRAPRNADPKLPTSLRERVRRPVAR